MNYRHIYHAGNFADIFKHIILTRVIEYLKSKPAAFRVIDTHAGVGLYNLNAEEAQKTGEGHQGLQNFFSAPFPAQVLPILRPWLNIVYNFNTVPTTNSTPPLVLQYLTLYPGSPLVIRKLLRRQDRLVAIELHPQDYQILAKHLQNDYQARVLHLDGWLAVKGHLPPKERRALIFIDPPFENTQELALAADYLQQAYKKFSTGMYAFWYPLKEPKAVNRFFNTLENSKIKKILRAELHLGELTKEDKLQGCGMALINPPYILKNELNILLPFLVERFASKKDAGFVLKQYNY